MSPAAAAASLAMIGDTDVRGVLPSVQCPTLVLRPEHETYLDERHSRYVAEHIPNARYAEVPGEGPFWLGEEDAVADEIQHFLTGVRRPVVSDRVLATVLFTDIVGSTERAAELGDGAWRFNATSVRRARSSSMTSSTVGGRSMGTAGPGRSIRAARVDAVETV